MPMHVRLRPVRRPACWLIPLVCLASATAARAEKPDFTRIDEHVNAIEVTPADGVDGVATKLMAPFRRDIERVRAIAWWMASNIRYDHEAHRVGVAQQKAGQAPMWVLPANEPAEVLRRRKAVCMGYSKLFAAFCRSVGIEAVEIGGNTRYSDEGHQWNAVRIDGAWHLIDVSSMASGAGNHGDGRGRPIEFYFLPPPDQFIFSHFPEDPTWQLLPQPVSRRQFDSIPVVLPPLFMVGVTPARLRKAASEGVDEFVPVVCPEGGGIILLDAPLGRRLRPGDPQRFRIRAAGHVAVHLNDGGSHLAFERRGDVFEATVSPRGPFLRVGVQREAGAIEGLLDYDVGTAGPARLGPDVASLINEARRRDGVGELTHDPQLDATALAHAEFMGRERSTPGRARCLVAAADNPDGRPSAELAAPLVASLLRDDSLRAWACAPPHGRVGVGATTVAGRTYFCIEFQ